MPPPLPTGVATLADLANDEAHPERGRWLAELNRRTADNERLREQRARLDAAAWDMLAFGTIYLAHYFTDAPAAFHRELVELLQGLDELDWFKTAANPDYDTARRAEPGYAVPPRVKRLDPSTGKPSTKAGIVVAAPRGHAKSTILTMLIPVYCACFRLRHFVVLISDSNEQVKSFCSDIKRELEENDLIRQDFGDLTGSAWGRKWTGEDFTIAHGTLDERGRKKVVHEMRLVGRSTNSRMRGLRNRFSRPDLVICDDIENDTHVETPEQRDKLYAKLNGAMIPMLDPHTGIFLFCGTILHFDSVLSRLLDQKQADNYVQKRWSAIKNGKSIHDDAAEPLWPERFPLEFLRVKRSQMPLRQFNQEYLNWPHDDTTRDFRPEWIRWYHHTHLMRLRDGTILWRDPDWTPHPIYGARLGDGYQTLALYSAADPAISQDDRADYFAHVVGGMAQETEDIITLWVTQERLNFAEQVAEIFSMHRSFPRLKLTGIEAVAYQEALKQAVEGNLLKRMKRSKIPIRDIKHRSGPKNKEARIRRRAVEVEAGFFWLRELFPDDPGYDEAPWDETGMHKVYPNHYPLYEEMMRFPYGAHDDVIDAWDMLVELMGRKKMFQEFAEAERRAANGKVPTTRTRGRRATVAPGAPGLDPDWEPLEAA